MNIHLKCSIGLNIRAISCSWSNLCFTWIFFLRCNSVWAFFSLSLFSHIFEHCFGLSIVQMSEILWNFFSTENTGEKKTTVLLKGLKYRSFWNKNVIQIVKRLQWNEKKRNKFHVLVETNSSLFWPWCIFVLHLKMWFNRFLNADRSAHCDNYSIE